MVNNNFITDIKTNANSFNKFFAEQCTPLKNDSVLPINQMFLNQSRLATLVFNAIEIPNQSGFCSSDSSVNQLLAITHEIFEAFDCNPPLEVRSVFLDISKAFGKV